MTVVEETVRTPAFWTFFKVHVDPLTEWAVRHHCYDQTYRYPSLEEAASELVVGALNAFGKRVGERHYDVKQGRPCKYVKQCIRNLNTDLLRRGGHPTTEECRSCWEEHKGYCPNFGTTSPWESHYHRCYQPPQITSFEENETVFSAAGIQQKWPPYLGEGDTSTGMQRPVEDTALDRVMVDCLTELMQSVLNEMQRQVLIMTFVDQATGPAIALELGTTSANVYQIRHRALRRLIKALTF